MFAQRATADPRYWGRFHWTILCNAKTEPLSRWKSMVAQLPHVLPCGSCRKSAFQFLMDPEHRLSDLKSPDEVKTWLTKFRHHSGADVKNPNTLDRFYLRSFLPRPFLVLDVVLGLYTTLMAVNDVCAEPVVRWIDLVLEMFELKPPPFLRWFSETQPPEAEIRAWCILVLATNQVVEPVWHLIFSTTASTIVFEPFAIREPSKATRLFSSNEKE